MPEAVEICKLRLFLKLASQVQRGGRLEPLPDVDFNIRAGNALVGYASREEVRQGLTTSRVGGGADQNELIFQDRADALAAFEERLTDVAVLAEQFREQQQTHGGEVTAADKETLRARLTALTDVLDRALAVEYHVDPDDEEAFKAWRDSHQPFHWFAEFYGVMSEGGFDVIVGNPPYVRLFKVDDYECRGYLTEAAGDLYSLVVERSIVLLHPRGYLGFIVPMSLSATAQTAPLRDLLVQALGLQWISHYSGDANPSKLFEGVKFRLDILLGRRDGAGRMFSSAYMKWFAEERSTLFERVRYEAVAATEKMIGVLPKTGNPAARSVLNKLFNSQPMGRVTVKTGEPIYVHRVITMFTKAFDFVPYFWNEQDGQKKSDDYKPYRFRKDERVPALAILNSSTFFLYFVALGDCFHCGKSYVESFPAGFNKMTAHTRSKLYALGTALVEDVRRNAIRKVAQSKKTGRVEYDEFWLRLSKPLIDEIDAVLARHYGFTDEELDFIVNYDIKYRLGADAFEEEEAAA